MPVGDDELDRLETALDERGAIAPDAIRELIDEIRDGRRSLELAARAVGLVSGAAVDLAGQAERLVEGYRKLTPIGDDGVEHVMTDFPAGFGPPVNDEATT